MNTKRPLESPVAHHRHRSFPADKELSFTRVGKTPWEVPCAILLGWLRVSLKRCCSATAERWSLYFTLRATFNLYLFMASPLTTSTSPRLPLLPCLLCWEEFISTMPSACSWNHLFTTSDHRARAMEHINGHRKPRTHLALFHPGSVLSGVSTKPQFHHLGNKQHDVAVNAYGRRET